MSLNNNAACFFNPVNSLFSVVVCACVILYVKPMIDNYSLSCKQWTVPLSTVVALAVVLQSVKSSAVPPSKERKVEKLLKAPLKKKKEERACACVQRGKKRRTRTHKKKPAFFLLKKKKKRGLGRRLNPTTCEGKKEKKKKVTRREYPIEYQAGKRLWPHFSYVKRVQKTKETEKKKKQLYVHVNNDERRDETIRHTHNARMKSSKRERKNRELSMYTKILWSYYLLAVKSSHKISGTNVEAK